MSGNEKSRPTTSSTGNWDSVATGEGALVAIECSIGGRELINRDMDSTNIDHQMRNADPVSFPSPTGADRTTSTD